ncbi:MAG: GLUG motif-containing protein [Candidatus Altiarchaeota archaeon]
MDSRELCNLTDSLLIAGIILIIFSHPLAAFAGGDGSLGDPFQITDCVELNDTRADLGANYVLNNEVDCSDTVNWEGGDGFTPISTFTGNFSGQNNDITDLYIDSTSTDVGLFGILDGGGRIVDLGLVDADITGGGNTGGLVGDLENGLINNAYVTGSVASSVDYVGGLVGYCKSNGLIALSYSEADVTGHTYVGGLVGYSNGDVISCYTTGTIDATGVAPNYHGGLIGSSSGVDVNTSYATGNVSGGSFNGGLIGGAFGSTRIFNSYALGHVSGNERIGGLIGDLRGPATNCYSRGSATGSGKVGGLIGNLDPSGTAVNSFSTGGVSAGSNDGGLVGYHNGGTLTNCWWYNDSSDNPDYCYTDSVSVPGNTGCTPDEDLSYFFTVGNEPTDVWDFGNIWDNVNDGGNTAPLLWQSSLKWTGVSCGDGSECDSGNCVDGVCCDTACAGACKDCDVAGSEGTCTNIPDGQDPEGECGNIDCSPYIFGWGVANSALSCRTESSTTEGYCGGDGACRSQSEECAAQDVEDGQSGAAACGSAACKWQCPNEGTATDYDTVEEVCYTDDAQHSCSAGEVCDATGTCTATTTTTSTTTTTTTSTTTTTTDPPKGRGPTTTRPEPTTTVKTTSTSTTIMLVAQTSVTSTLRKVTTTSIEAARPQPPSGTSTPGPGGNNPPTGREGLGKEGEGDEEETNYDTREYDSDVNVKLDFKDLSHARAGEVIGINVTVQADSSINGLRTFIITSPGIRMIEYDEVINLDDVLVKELTWKAVVEDDAGAGRYFINASLIDVQGSVKSIKNAEVILQEGIDMQETVMPEPEGLIERVFNIMRRVFNVIYRNRFLFMALFLVLMLMAYAYYSYRKRRIGL